jgi:hypothetical protein
MAHAWGRRHSGDPTTSGQFDLVLVDPQSSLYVDVGCKHHSHPLDHLHRDRDPLSDRAFEHGALHGLSSGSCELAAGLFDGGPDGDVVDSPALVMLP